MKNRDWIPPFEVAASETKEPREAAAPKPRVVAEEGEAEFDTLLRQSAPTPDAAEQSAPDSRPQRSRSPLKWLLAFVALFLIVVSGVESYALLVDYYRRDLLLGAIVTIPLVGIFAALFALVGRELRGYLSVRTADALRAEGERLLASDASGPARRHLAQLTPIYRDRPDVQAGLERFHLQHASTHSDRETVALYARLVLGPLDARVYRAITHYSVDTAVLSALSSLSSLDALLSTWRNVRMIREIARLYGLRPGFLGSLALFRLVARNLVIAGASDYLADSAAEALGGQLGAMVSARLGQGMANGMLTARLGILAAEQCRPLPFVADDRHGLRRLRADILGQIRQRLTSMARAR